MIGDAQTGMDKMKFQAAVVVVFLAIAMFLVGKPLYLRHQFETQAGVISYGEVRLKETDLFRARQGEGLGLRNGSCEGLSVNGGRDAVTYETVDGYSCYCSGNSEPGNNPLIPFRLNRDQTVSYLCSGNVIVTSKNAPKMLKFIMED